MKSGDEIQGLFDFERPKLCLVRLEQRQKSNHRHVHTTFQIALGSGLTALSRRTPAACRKLLSVGYQLEQEKCKLRSRAANNQAFVQDVPVFRRTRFMRRKSLSGGAFGNSRRKSFLHLLGPNLPWSVQIQARPSSPSRATVTFGAATSKTVATLAQASSPNGVHAHSTRGPQTVCQVTVFRVKQRDASFERSEMANSVSQLQSRELCRKTASLGLHKHSGGRVSMVSQSAPVIGTAQEHLWTSVFRPEVFRAALMAIWQMSLFLILGSILHRIHVLDVHTVQGLSKAVYHIFLPALCFVNISAEAASGHYASMVTLLLAASIHIAIGIAAGEVLSHWMKIPERKRRLVKIACGFGNSTALPALFYNSIFASDPSRASSCLGLMSIYCIMWTAAFWPYFHANFSASIGDANQQENGAESVDSRSRSSGIGIEASTTDKSALLHSGMFLWAARRLESVFYALGTPPAFASIVGLLVGLLSPLRSFLYGNNQVISVGLLRTLKTLAAANGACALLVLAASLATKVPKSQTEPADEFIDSNGSSSLAESGGGLAHPLDAVLGLYRRARRLFRSADLGILLPALITRCVLLPCVSLAIVFPLANHFRLFPDGLAGQLLRFVILLQGVMPPAQNIVIGLQLEGDRNEATYASRQLLVIYLVSLLPLSLLLTFFLGALHI